MHRPSWPIRTFIALTLASWVAPGARGLPGATNGEPPDAGRRPVVFRATTDMLAFDSPSSRMFIDWQRDANALAQVGLDTTLTALDLRRADQGLARLGVLSAFTAVGLVVTHAFSITAHDERHLEAARAIGASSVGLVTDRGEPMTVGAFFLQAFNVTREPGLYFYEKSGATTDERARVAGAGLDANLQIASEIARCIAAGSGHITDLAPYLENKLWGISYFLESGPASDAETYMNLLDAQGFGEVNRTNVLLLTAGSCLLSGGFLSLARGTYETVTRGTTRVDPLGLSVGPATLFWPEVSPWLNARSVSVSVLANAAWGADLRLLAGAESPVLGDTARTPELTAGATARIRWLSLSAEVTSDLQEFPFLLGRVRLDLGNGAFVGAEAWYGQGTTLREAREFPLGPGGTIALEAAY